MRVLEILEAEDDNVSAISSKITSVLSHIHGRREDTGAKKDMPLKALLKYLRDAGVNVSDSQFRDMASKEPVNNFISNVKGNKVEWLGQSENNTPEKPDNSEQTIKKMAKKAAKNAKT